MDLNDSHKGRLWNTNTYGAVPRASMDIASTRNTQQDQSTSYEAFKKESRISLTPRTSISAQELPVKRGSLATWGLELFAVTVSLLSVIAIIAVLHRENGKPLTVWKFSLTLNTIIAALGTLSRTTLAFALSSCVGQQKWTWLRRKTDRLVAFERFDEASRGPWGAIRLFLWLRMRHWAALGALAIMGTVMFDPFLQAVLSTTGQLNNISSAQILGAQLNTTQLSSNISNIAQALRVDGGTLNGIPSGPAMMVKTKAGTLNFYGGTSSRPDLGIVSSINNGFHSASTFQSNRASMSCSTGNCTWDDFASAAVCSSCNDVSNQLKIIKGKDSHAPQVPIPTNIDLDAEFVAFKLAYSNITNLGITKGNISKPAMESDILGRTYMTMNLTTDPAQTLTFKNSETLLMAFAIILGSPEYLDGSTSWNETTPIATECALYMCANVYRSRVENSELKEEVIGSWAVKDNGSYRPDPNSKAFEHNKPAEAWVDEYGKQLYDRSVPRTDLRIIIPKDESKNFPDSMARSFNISYNFLRSTADGLEAFATSGNTGKYEGDELTYFPTSRFTPAIEALWLARENITQKFDDIAISLTNQIRNTALTRFEGQAKNWTIHMRVRWEYFAFPAMVLLGGILYVVLTIVESMRLGMPVWKESAMPTLLHGFDDETQHLLRGTEAASKRGASSIRVKFAYDEKGAMRLNVAG